MSGSAFVNEFLRDSSFSHPLVLGHRGARSLAPENTLAAGKACREVGASGWEFDVQLTRDGEPVLLHDETLQRTTNVEQIFPDRAHLSINHFTLQEVKYLNAGSWFVHQDPYQTITRGEVPRERLECLGQEGVPTLEEALSLSRALGLLVNIELKAPPHKPSLNTLLLEKTLQLVHKFGMDNKVLLSSFNAHLIRQLKERAPHIPGALLSEFMPPDPIEYLQEIRADALNLWKGNFNEQLAEKIVQAGFGIFLWTVNDPSELRYFFRHPFIKGVITDWPQRVTLRVPG